MDSNLKPIQESKQLSNPQSDEEDGINNSAGMENIPEEGEDSEINRKQNNLNRKTKSFRRVNSSKNEYTKRRLNRAKSLNERNRRRLSGNNKSQINAEDKNLDNNNNITSDLNGSHCTSYANTIYNRDSYGTIDSFGTNSSFSSRYSSVASSRRTSKESNYSNYSNYSNVSYLSGNSLLSNLSGQGNSNTSVKSMPQRMPSTTRFSSSGSRLVNHSDQVKQLSETSINIAPNSKYSSSYKTYYSKKFVAPPDKQVCFINPYSETVSSGEEKDRDRNKDKDKKQSKSSVDSQTKEGLNLVDQQLKLQQRTKKMHHRRSKTILVKCWTSSPNLHRFFAPRGAYGATRSACLLVLGDMQIHKNSPLFSFSPFPFFLSFSFFSPFFLLFFTDFRQFVLNIS